MKGLRSILFTVVLLIAAGIIGFGVDKLCTVILPAGAAGVMTNPYTFGARALSFGFSLCGVIGLLLSYIFVSYIMKK